MVWDAWAHWFESNYLLYVEDLELEPDLKAEGSGVYPPKQQELAIFLSSI